jgi:TnpA family transposase
MSSIERTAYPRFTRAPSVKELREIYTPTPTDVAFVATKARGPAQKFALMILLKVYQRLHHFPDPQNIPGAVISHIRAVMKLPDDLVPDISPATLYRYYGALREHLELESRGKHVRHVAAQAMHTAAQTMENPADLINAAIETLLVEHGELPAFSTLDRMAGRIRRLVNRGIYQTVFARIAEAEQQALSRLLEPDGSSSFTAFDRIKDAPQSATLTHLDEWLSRLTWLQSWGSMDPFLAGMRSSKITHLAQEARSLYPSDLLDFSAPRRLTLLACLIAQATISTRDEIIQMFLKRMSKLTEKAKQELERLREEERTITEHLVEVLADVVQASTDAQGPADRGTHVRAILDKEGGEALLLEQCELVSAHHGDRYQPFVKKFYGSHRNALFRVIKTLDLRSTTSDQRLIDAMNFIMTNEHNPKQYLEATLALSFASKKWQRTVLVKRRGKSWFRRQHLETCVFSRLADELKTGDICCLGSEQFADYRDQLLPWSECEPKVAAYCHQLGLPATAKGLVEHVRTWLTETAAEVDRTRPGNQELMINEKGEPSLKRLKAKAQPAGLLQLEEALHQKIPERHLLDVVVRMERLTGFGRHLGPLSGNEPKMDDARARQLLALFAYGTNLGPHQMARHLRGTLDADQIAHINRRHITAEKLDAALRDVKNCFNRYTLPHYWGEEKRAASDGTQYELAEENLLAEKHIRYGGFGGIAYHHVSDMYILLFSHFIGCGVHEAIYLLDGLIRNRSDIKPSVIHADTHGQNLPVFGLSFLLGIELMPRIRNWKDLKFYRPSKEVVYEHIDSLFHDNVVDWDLIETHWQDLFQVVISIQEGKVLPSMLLRKLGTSSHKNRLYQAFYALGCVIRTAFLLTMISDVKLREVIHRATNKMEQYNALEDWVRFAKGGVMYEHAFEEQEKQVKYTGLLTSCVILDNTVEISAALNTLAREGYLLTIDEVAALSPYQTRHIKRFGNYEIDFEAVPTLNADDLTFTDEVPLSRGSKK